MSVCDYGLRLVWTPLYATIAYATGHALGTTTTPRQRNRLISSPAVNLTLNAGWNWTPRSSG